MHVSQTIMPTANIPQSKFLQMTQKFRAFVAGFGSGKTWVGCMAMANHALSYPHVNQGYFAPTYAHIRDIYFPTIEEVCYDYGLTVKIRKGDKEVDIIDGRKRLCTVICRSMDNPANIIGFKIGHALVDEIDVMPTQKARDAWMKLPARLRWKDEKRYQKGVKNGIDVTTTPEGFKFVYQQFVEFVQQHPKKAYQYGLIQASTYDNAANLNDDYIEALLNTYPEELISAYLNGQFVNLAAGTVYYAYHKENHRSLAFVEPNDLLRIGMDFNVTNMSAVVYVLRNNDTEWHAVDEFKGVYDTPAMIESIKERYPERSIRVYPDASGKSRKTVDASISDISLLESAGFAVYANGKNPLVKDRVIAANLAFQQGLLYINDLKCPEYSKCMLQLAYDKNGEPDKKSNLDHLPDAGTYPIAYEMPVIKPIMELKTGFTF